MECVELSLHVVFTHQSREKEREREPSLLELENYDETRYVLRYVKPIPVPKIVEFFFGTQLQNIWDFLYIKKNSIHLKNPAIC